MSIFAIAFVWLGTSAFTQTCDAKVVSVHDGDTITVYDGRKQTRIRLDGIDCPENGTDFSEQAKQFTSNLVFGKQVRIKSKETDRYGRLVARVIVNGTDVSLALVEAGLAWHYKQYSNNQILAATELIAREKRVGVWSLPNPVPPWDYRSGVASGTTSSTGPYHGNSQSKVYHAKDCQYFDCKNCTVNLDSKRIAASQGFRPHERCVDVTSDARAFDSREGEPPYW